MTQANTYNIDKEHATDVRAPLFTDGMIVNASDLNAGMQYPVDLMLSLNRAYFGCGIVCGLGVDAIGDNGFKLKVEPGLALDCHGYPVHLTEACELDLSPDPCKKPASGEYYLAIRRFQQSESSRPDSEICESTGKPKVIYTRAREMTKLQLFYNTPECLPKEICLSESPAVSPECDCLRACPPAHCCSEEAWVLLASVVITIDDKQCAMSLSTSKRQYVKPIACHCDNTDNDNGGSDDGDDLHNATRPSAPKDNSPTGSDQARIEDIQQATTALDERSAALEKELKALQATISERAVSGDERAISDNEKAINDKIKRLESTITDLKKSSGDLEKSLSNKLKPTEIEKLLDKRFKAMEDKLAKLEEMSEETPKETTGKPASKRAATKSSTKPTNN